MTILYYYCTPRPMTRNPFLFWGSQVSDVFRTFWDLQNFLFLKIDKSVHPLRPPALPGQAFSGLAPNLLIFKHLGAFYASAQLRNARLPVRVSPTMWRNCRLSHQFLIKEFLVIVPSSIIWLYYVHPSSAIVYFSAFSYFGGSWFSLVCETISHPQNQHVCIC